MAKVDRFWGSWVVYGKDRLAFLWYFMTLWCLVAVVEGLVKNNFCATSQGMQRDELNKQCLGRNLNFSQLLDGILDRCCRPLAFILVY